MRWLTALPFLFSSLAWSQQGMALPVMRWAESLTNPRAAMEQAGRHGVAFQYQYVHDLSQAPLGAPGNHDWYGRYTWTLAASVDLRKAVGWSSASGFVSVKEHAQEFGRLYSEVAQGYSNLDAAAHTTLYEAWGQQSFADNRLLLKAGRIDANADFDVVPTAGDFLNSSMGYSPTVMGFPSYPAPQPGVELLAGRGDPSRVSVGYFHTAGGSLLLAEGDRKWGLGQGQLPGRAAVGIWHLRQVMTAFDGESISGTNGLYGVLEQVLWPSREPEAGNGRSLSGFLQWGTGSERVNPYTRHLGGGLVLTAPLARRLGDSLGIAATWVRTAPEAGPGETAVELFYKLNLTRTLSLISDVQYFRHPGGTGVQSASLVATPRLVISF